MSEEKPILLPENSTMTFEANEVIIKGKNIETKWPNGVPLNFEDFDTLVFSGKGKKYTYTKVS